MCGLQVLSHCPAAYSYADHVTLGCWLEVLDVDEEVNCLQSNGRDGSAQDLLAMWLAHHAPLDMVPST